MDHTCLNKKSNIWALNSNTVPFSSFAFCRWCKTSWNMSGSLSKSYRRCWVVICEPCRPVTSKCNDTTLKLDALKLSMKMVTLCTIFEHLINHITILISVYAKKQIVFIQTEQFRQRHPVWEPGGDPHLPAGTVCGIRGVHQVRHTRHKWHGRTPVIMGWELCFDQLAPSCYWALGGDVIYLVIFTKWDTC